MKFALAYARLGWAVVPLHDVTSGACSCGKPDCRSAGKHPRLKAWEQEATNDEATVTEWFTAWPAANVGIATGYASGFFVLDVDPDKGGNEALAALIAEHGELPETVRAQTGSGGTHYLFTLPGFEIRNSAGKLGAGLDTRGDGGQIVVAPSRSAKGPYSWIVSPARGEIAAAPDWLLEALRSAPARETGDAGSAEVRGFFPAASLEVLAAARSALERHGPAIDGEGGGLHTVQAGAILTHDFALTDDEAWPLFAEWNETCSPPWELEGENSLREKFENGRKYGKADYGKRRSMDAQARGSKVIEDWRAAGADESKVEAMVKAVREIVGAGVDPTVRALIERDLKGATGLNTSDLALPKKKPQGDVGLTEGQIKVTPELHKVADAAVEAIDEHVFVRNGVLCEVVKAERTFISDLQAARIQDLMSRSAEWVRVDDDGVTQMAPPMPVAIILHARRTFARTRVLEAVTTAPVFLPDGSILQTRGYNRQARLFLEPSVAVDVPDDPTKADARNAVRMLKALLSDFKFAEPADFSAWLASLLTPLVKAATRNAPSPLFCVSASSPGAGKTLLTKVVARIVTGEEAEVRPYNPRDPGEWGKRLTAFVKMAAPVSVFDNVNGAFGDEGIERLVTTSVWSDRILGVSDAPPLPNVTTWFATGNNIEPVGDTVRRSLLIRIEVDTERPQERSDFKIKNLEHYVVEHRSELLSAALTILRAFHVAGRPAQKIEEWGSFETWSGLVRAALVWTGLRDPFETQKRAALTLNEPENEAHDFWLSIITESDGNAGSIVALANQRDARGVLGIRDEITPFTLKRFLNRFIDKPRTDKRIRRDVDTRQHQTLYYVEAISA